MNSIVISIAVIATLAILNARILYALKRQRHPLATRVARTFGVQMAKIGADVEIALVVTSALVDMTIVFAILHYAFNAF